MSDQPIAITGTDVGAADQARRYELATLQHRLVDAEPTLAGAEAWVNRAEAGGTLLGAWVSEHGPLGRLYVLRAFVDHHDLAAEQAAAAADTMPFGAGPHVTGLSMEGFAPFPFMPPVRAGSFGSVYEIRDYRLVPGGLPGTIDGWREKLPGRHLVDPIVVVMYALDGPARIVHIWPFVSMDERVAVRRDLYLRGLWPPSGGPERIASADSIMAWPTPWSPLH